MLEEGAASATLDAKTREFFEFFGKRVSEWNPCFSEDGEQRVSFLWDEEVGAHDVEVAERTEPPDGFDQAEPSRIRLSDVLADVLHPPTPTPDAEASDIPGRGTDLSKIRYLVGALVQKWSSRQACQDWPYPREAFLCSWQA